MTFSAEELDRFEPIGTNCETGFVLRRLGSERPSLFRWNSLRPENFCRLLDADFDGAFALEKLAPLTPNMVRDTAYDWSFHTALKSTVEKKFELEGRELERMHRIEKIKLEHEEAIFAQRLHGGGLVCILAAVKLGGEELEAVLGALDRFAGNNGNQLLAVTEPTALMSEPGHVFRLAPRISQGIVTRMAPYDRADDADYENWSGILRDIL